MKNAPNCIAAILLCTIALAGCSHKPAAKAAANPPPPAAAETPPAPPAEESAVEVAADIVKACDITGPEAHFAFNSAKLQGTDTRTLDKIATCFSSGPLKDKTLKVVGHTDARGGSEYNIALGQSRADAIAGYLVKKGVTREHSQSSSRGQMDAIGKDESSWARDRRVDLMLAQ